MLLKIFFLVIYNSPIFKKYKIFLKKKIDVKRENKKKS